MKQIPYTILFIICWNTGMGQFGKILSDDSLRLEKATSYLARKLGETFVNKKLAYTGTYQDVLLMVNFEIKDSIKSDRNAIIVFFNGAEIDTIYNTKVTSADIEEYYKGNKTKNIFLNRDTAISIAKDQNLPIGIRAWDVKLAGVMDEVGWEVKSYEKISGPPYKASGQMIHIDARTGKFKFSEWSEMQ